MDGQEFGQAFPVVQDDDPFGGFPGNHSKMDSTDPFASASNDMDPFAAFEIKMTAKKANNPFLADNEFSIVGEDFPAPSTVTSRSATPIEQQSVQSDEHPWPGNNTVDSFQEISRDSAAVNSSSEVPEHLDFPAMKHSCADLDSSESSASSGRAVPNIALDSDSGNLTVDINENVPPPNAVYALVESTQNDNQIPTVVLTEPSLNSDKSSLEGQVDTSSSAEEGQTRLLETTDTDSSQDPSVSNIASISSNDGTAFAQADNLSTMNISLLTTSDEPVDCQNTEPTEAHNFFVNSDSCQESEEQEGKEGTVAKTHLPHRVSTEDGETDSLPKPKADRVFTSSPITPRTISPEAERDPLVAWRRDFDQRIATKDEKETKDIKELRERAAKDLEEWYNERQTRIEAQHTIHLGDQEVLYTEQEVNDNIWQRMSKLALELQHSQKVDEKRKDTSKMKHLLQFLTFKVPAPKEQFRSRS